ncbi:hypothetical protein K501DRAFT_279177 [Backusella circina FSU 941]|nr:hypothetical protein K501DRAFT_279177 [Backusella circina FSU 941]
MVICNSPARYVSRINHTNPVDFPEGVDVLFSELLLILKDIFQLDTFSITLRHTICAYLIIIVYYTLSALYYGFIMGVKGSTAIKTNDMILSLAHILLSIRIVQYFDLPFLAARSKSIKEPRNSGNICLSCQRICT